MNIACTDVRLIGASAAHRSLNADIEAAAAYDAKVLITGETGVGKDVVARLIHQRSARRARPLAAINCAGLSDTLLESELFGHVRGSFTGAYRDKPGLFEAADRGTAFLDEAGEMSARMQGVLLRFLETGELQRVGQERGSRRVNVRIIAATNRNLAEQVASGHFREDLYYRLNVIRIHVPALRQRPDDIPALFDHFAHECARESGVAARTLTPEAEQRLRDHRWPGNVRELRNLVQRLVIIAPGEPVLARDVRDLEPAAALVAFTPAGHSATGPGRDATSDLLRRMTSGGESFWSVVHEPFMARDLSRDELRAVVRAGLEQAAGNYRALVGIFGMKDAEYKPFLRFLRKHGCHVPFQPFRALRMRPATITSSRPAAGYPHAIGM